MEECFSSALSKALCLLLLFLSHSFFLCYTRSVSKVMAGLVSQMIHINSKQQTAGFPLQSNSPRVSCTFHPSLPRFQAMLQGFFWDALQLRRYGPLDGLHASTASSCQTINQQVYKEILRRLLPSVRKQKRELWQDKSWREAQIVATELRGVPEESL